MKRHTTPSRCWIMIAMVTFITLPSRAQFYEPRIIHEGHLNIYLVSILDFNYDNLDDIVAIRGVQLPNGQVGQALHVYTAFMDQDKLSYTVDTSTLPYSRNGALWPLDVDFDGDIDYIVQGVYPSDSYRYTIENIGGAFEVRTTYPDFLSDPLMKIRHIEDLDYDGYPEILFEKQQLWLGSYKPGEQMVFRSVLPQYQEVIGTADFNQDGFKELLISDRTNHDLVLLASDHDFEYSSIVLDSVYGVDEVIGISDYTQEGRLSVLMFDYATSSIQFIFPDLAAHDYTISTAIPSFPFQAKFYGADFNADGFDDFACGSGTTSYYLNDGTGQFSETSTGLRNDLEGPIISARVDIDSQQATFYFKFYGLEKLHVDHGTYVQSRIPFPDLPILYTSDIELHDINSDSIQDIVLCLSDYEGGITYIEGKEQKTFGAMHTLQADEIGVNNFELADFDGDGFTDLLYSATSGVIKIEQGNGTGKFCCARELHYVPEAHELLAEDFEHDGFHDIIVATDSSILIMRNHAGVLDTPEIIYDGINYRHFTLDVDADGDLDVVFGGIGSIIHMLINSGTGEFDFVQTTLPFRNRYEFHDFDFDGRPEYVANDDDIEIYRYSGASYGLWHTIPNADVGFEGIMVILDYNHDGYDDFIYASYNDPVRLVKNAQNLEFVDDGLFADRYGFTIPNGTSPSNFFHAADFDDDGDLDLFYDHQRKYYWVSQINGTQTLSGNVFHDQNQNSVADSAEAGIRDMKVTATHDHGLTISSFTDDEGNFRMKLDTGAYYLQFTSLSPCWKTDETLPLTIALAESEIDSVNMPFFIEGSAVDVSGAASYDIPRCHSQVIMRFLLQNTGCKTLDGEVRIILSEFLDGVTPLLTIPYALEGRQIIFDADSLMPGESRRYDVAVNMPGPEYLFFLFRHDLIYRHTPADGSGSEELFSQPFYHPLRCAYDPNDKLATPDRTGIYGDAYVENEDLFYTIRFQNTGNDTAFTVRLEDTISSMLDLSTFRPVYASHPYRLELIEDNRLLVVHFEDILLPDSTTNRDASQGYFTFSIRPNPGIADYTHINNSAGIYFDLNEPVLTNTTKLIYVSDLSILTIATTNSQGETLVIFPNPAKGTAHFEASFIPDEIVAHDTNGNPVTLPVSNETISLGNLASGMYTIEVRAGKRRFHQRLIIQ